MLTKVIMPQLSLTMQFGIVTQWLKKEGDFINKGEPVCSIEGDKASVEIEAPASGYIKKLVAQMNTEFPVKEAVAYIGNIDDVVIEEPEPSIEPDPNQPKELGFEITKPISEKRIFASPVAKRLAVELGVDLTRISGSGPDGLINREDVVSANSNKTNKNVDAQTKVFSQTKLIGIKKTIADRLTKSYQAIPHIHLSLNCDMTEVIHFRDNFNQQTNNGVHITFTDLIIFAVSRALLNDRILNSSLVDDLLTIYEDINIGFAAETEKGLVVPVIKNASALSIVEISKKREELAGKVKKGEQTIDDLSQGTFTITNLGMFMVDEFDPIINFGQSGILGVGRIIKTPVVDIKGDIVSHQLIKLTLACDHRVAGGVEGAHFLAFIKTVLEDPKVIFN